MIVDRIDLDEIKDVANDTALDPVYMKRIMAMMQKDELVLFAAKDGDRYVGRVSLWLADADEELPRKKFPGVPLVNALEVDGSHRRKGTATMLLESLEYEARERGAQRVALGVEPDNEAAIVLYEKLGYRATGDHYESCWEESDGHGAAKRFCVDTMLMLKDL